MIYSRLTKRSMSVIFLITCVFFPTATRADLFTSIQICVQDAGCLAPLSGADGGPRTATEAGGGSNYSYSASGFAAADYGVLKLSGQASASTDALQARSFAQVSAIAENTDRIIITNNNLTGQTGFINATIFVSASLSATNAQSFWDFSLEQLDLGSPILQLRQGLSDSCGACNFSEVNLQPGNPLGLFTFAIPFTFGSPFSLRITANGNTTAAGADGSDGFGTFDLENSIYWGGISSVTANGDVVPYSLISDSGFDWTQSRIPVGFEFTGFLSPVNNSPTLNVMKAGAAVPIKFSLNGNRGLGVLAVGSPSSRPVTCDTALSSDSVETTLTAGNSSLSYDANTDVYTYVWKTDKAWAGTCRELNVELIDNNPHKALFKFTR